MNSIKAENIKVAYGDKIIIDHLNIHIPTGKITTIIGPNGCGKSTFLKAAGRILNIHNGCIYLNGADIHTLTTKEIAKSMAILPQSPQAPEGIQVEELISYGRFPHQKGMGRLTKEDKDIIQWAIDATNLTGLEKIAVDSLSGGQRQRVWIAMALAQKTELILLDEPTTYLDMAYQLEVLELLEELNQEQGCTIVMVLHDINLASKFADYMIALRDGKVISHGDPYQVMKPSVLREIFQIEADIMTDTKSNKPMCLTYQLMHKVQSNDKEGKKGA